MGPRGVRRVDFDQALHALVQDGSKRRRVEKPDGRWMEFWIKTDPFLLIGNVAKILDESDEPLPTLRWTSATRWRQSRFTQKPEVQTAG